MTYKLKCTKCGNIELKELKEEMSDDDYYIWKKSLICARCGAKKMERYSGSEDAKEFFKEECVRVAGWVTDWARTYWYF